MIPNAVALLAVACLSMASVTVLIFLIHYRRQALLLKESAERLKHFKENEEEAHHFLDAIIENVPDSIFVKDARDLRFVMVNRACEQMIGSDKERLIGKTDYDFFSREEADFFTSKDREVLTSGKMMEIPEETILGTTLTVLHTKKIPINDEQGRPRYLLGIARDITEMKKSMEDRERMRHHLEQAQKLESVGRLAGGVAHDFNNILSSILGYATLLKDELEGNAEAQKKLSVIEKSAERGASLSRELLAFAKGEPSEKSPVDINSIIHEVLELVGKKENIPIEVRLADNTLLVMGDSNQILQAILNLVVNARDAMPGGGALTVLSGKASLDAASSARLANIAPGHYAFVSVSDTGSGIAKAVRDRIFEPFFTTKEIGQGTGLGLSMIYGIMKAHLGAVDFSTEEGRGTTFTLYFPI